MNGFSGLGISTFFRLAQEMKRLNGIFALLMNDGSIRFARGRRGFRLAQEMKRFKGLRIKALALALALIVVSLSSTNGLSGVGISIP